MREKTLQLDMPRYANRVRRPLLAVLLFAITFVMCDVISIYVARIKENSVFVRQRYLYTHFLDKDKGRSIEEMLPETKFTRISDNEYCLKDCGNYCYPGVWGKPGRILIKRKCGKFYCVTFGDGTSATVTYFQSGVMDDPNNHSLYIQPTAALAYNYIWFWIIPLGAMVIAATLCLQRETDKRRVLPHWRPLKQSD